MPVNADAASAAGVCPVKMMRDNKPKASNARDAFVIFLIRAYEFWNHPYFRGELAGTDLRIVFESPAFRLRPIAMVESDDCSIWATVDRLEETKCSSRCADFRGRYCSWFDLSDADLRTFWPPAVPWASQPPPGSELENWTYRPAPSTELWDRVFGDGAHSDFQRVLRNRATDWSAGAALGAAWHMARMLALIGALRPLVVDIHNTVLDEIAAPGEIR